MQGSKPALPGWMRALVPPLSYGVRDGFAHLPSLKGLEGLLHSVKAQIVEQTDHSVGSHRELLERLSTQLRGFDHWEDHVRRQALVKLVQELSMVGELPEPLNQLVKVRPESSSESSTIVAQEASKPTSKLTSEKTGTKITKNKRAKEPEALRACSARVSPYGGAGLAIAVSETAKSSKLQKVIQERGISTVEEALFYFPRAYEDRRKIVNIAQLRTGERGVSIGEVKLAGETTVGRRKVFRVVLGDSTGTVAVTWYHYVFWMKQRFVVGRRFLFTGEVKSFGGMREIAHPEMELIEDNVPDPAHFGRIVPLYSGFERGDQRAFRAWMYQIVPQYGQELEDPLPETMLQRLGLPVLSEAVQRVHFPEKVGLETLLAHRTRAQRRLAYDELFFIELGMALRRKGVQLTSGIAFTCTMQEVDKALAYLPFSFTGDQKKAFEEIKADMLAPEPMNRLLQGDVGSGKTAVAFAALMIAVQNGYQAAFMAPTEILAEQHCRNFENWLKDETNIKVVLLKSSIARKSKEEIKKNIASGEVQIVVGTHALLQENVSFARLGIVVVDEQHRFGVLQRAQLMQKGVRPDVLVMTATPIPRTLAMTLYGDLEVSVIRQMPPGRKPVKTRVFRASQRELVYQMTGNELIKGRQAFVIYPLVEESEKLDLQSATEGAQLLAERFPEYRVGLVHGKMAVEEKEAAMEAFRSGQSQILVSTTVVEVGVDFPNASVMLIESAERFGLSQLHQLRGRVGRGQEVSYCYLIGPEWCSENAYQRLTIMAQTSDGFEIAEKDLQIRGPGELLGTKQSGVPGLVRADLIRDQDLLLVAKKEARILVENDRYLHKPEHQRLRQVLDKKWEGNLPLSQVG